MRRFETPHVHGFESNNPNNPPGRPVAGRPKSVSYRGQKRIPESVMPRRKDGFGGQGQFELRYPPSRKSRRGRGTTQYAEF